MTQSELAEKSNTIQRNISNWENGVAEPDCKTILKLAEVFEVTVDELFGRVERPLNEKRSGADKQILALVRQLSDTQKYALLQFLREMSF